MRVMVYNGGLGGAPNGDMKLSHIFGDGVFHFLIVISDNMYKSYVQVPVL